MSDAVQLFELDDDFLAKVGLNDLPREFRRPFLVHVYDEIESRVGERLSDGMSFDQLAEFEAIIDRRTEVIDDWIAQHAPEYLEDEIYQHIKELTQADDSTGVLAEYVATKWLEMNRSDYREVVQATLDELRREIHEHRDEILRAATPGRTKAADSDSRVTGAESR